MQKPIERVNREKSQLWVETWKRCGSERGTKKGMVEKRRAREAGYKRERKLGLISSEFLISREIARLQESIHLRSNRNYRCNYVRNVRHDRNHIHRASDFGSTCIPLNASHNYVIVNIWYVRLVDELTWYKWMTKYSNIRACKRMFPHTVDKLWTYQYYHLYISVKSSVQSRSKGKSNGICYIKYII